MYTIHEPDKLFEFINGELKPKEKEKRQNGEVFTPLSLVNEMLDKLDEAYIKEHGKSIFTEDGFKWLDPAVGIGNFPIIVYQRLMKGLNISNEEERRKHILEQMMYMAEISDKSICILGKIFCGDKYKLNIHKGSFLDSKCKYDFTFDVVMGNPPYNPPKTETGSSGNSIWPQFVIKSFYMVKGYLLFIHPPGWKKPTDELFDPQKLDILGGEYYKYDKKTGKQTIKQIRQGQVWQVLKDNGSFSFIYTNDQKKKGKEYIPFFPAVDYYVYQKNGAKTSCNTNNIFLGQTKEASGVVLNYKLNYLPNLITSQTQHILHKVTTKEGKKTNFNRGIDERKINWNGKIINWVYNANKKGFQYKKHGINASSENGKTKEDTVGINKIILNFGGGISSYNVKYISTSEEIGVLDMTMYSKVETESEGLQIEKFFKSDIVKFIFLVTQYASGAITQNEPLVANSITIPPEDVDYYAFFDIEKDKAYIEDVLTHYVYQKNGTNTSCNTKNIFLGQTKEASGVVLNYKLNYLPNLITSQTQHILHKVTTKEGKKPKFYIYRDKPADFFLDKSNGKYRYIYTFNKKHEPQYKYSNSISKDDNINMNKIIMNFGGGIDSYTVIYVSDKDNTGSYHMTMYSKVETESEGLQIEKFFKSDIVKFIFLVTQYASGKMTKNEPLVANSITIPPEDIDYYAFFDIEKDKAYIEDVLTHYKGSKKINL